MQPCDAARRGAAGVSHLRVYFVEKQTAIVPIVSGNLPSLCDVLVAARDTLFPRGPAAAGLDALPADRGALVDAPVDAVVTPPATDPATPSGQRERGHEEEQRDARDDARDDEEPPVGGVQLVGRLSPRPLDRRAELAVLPLERFCALERGVEARRRISHLPASTVPRGSARARGGAR